MCSIHPIFTPCEWSSDEMRYEIFRSEPMVCVSKRRRKKKKIPWEEAASERLNGVGMRKS